MHRHIYSLDRTLNGNHSRLTSDVAAILPRSTPLFTVHYCGGYLLGMVVHHSKMNALNSVFDSQSHSASYKVDLLTMADTSDDSSGGGGLI